MIEDHANVISRSWVRDVQQHPDTLSYHHMPESKLQDRAFAIYSHLGQWIQDLGNRGQWQERYVKLGADRYHEGVPLSEVVKATMLLRRHLWFFLMEDGLFSSAPQLYQFIEFHNNVILFFDRAIHCTVKGFEREAELDRRVHATAT
jgi:hypothetical protein